MDCSWNPAVNSGIMDSEMVLNPGLDLTLYRWNSQHGAHVTQFFNFHQHHLKSLACCCIARLRRGSFEGVAYSQRRAITGSTRVARHAGIKLAAIAMPASKPVTAAKVTGSVAFTP